MKKLSTLLLIAASSLTACSDWLSVNTNPNAPQTVSANLYLPPMIHWMVTSPQFDGRFVGHYTQQWISTAAAFEPAQSWGHMGYQPGSDNGAQQWRDVYWSLGQNLVDMTTKAEAEQRWDLLGVGLILKAWGWQVLSDLHGPIIIQEAFNQTKFTFGYDSEEFAYQEIERLLDSAIVLLRRTDGAVDPVYLGKGDKLYNGDRVKWLKLAHGMLALSLNHYSNKLSGLYDAARVMREVDSSFVGNTDDALFTYPGADPLSADKNFWGRTRDNATNYRQTQFIVGLMNGTQFGGVVDPRMSRMLALDSAGTTYTGLNIDQVAVTATFGALTVPQRPRNFFGYTGTGGLGLPGRYLFADRAKIPVMTYSQLQFIKAEAALRMGDPAAALTAYRNGVSSHIDFVNARNLDDGQSPTQINATEKANFLADTNIVPVATSLTLSHIMSQKFIAQFAWGHNELWMDMRRYHYTDSVGGIQVFRGFIPPLVLFSDNSGELVQRIRPRFNSEYVWNRAALAVIDGLDLDYHTHLLWITEP